MEGRRILVGGGAAATACCFLVVAALVLDEDVEFSDDASFLSLSLSFAFSLSFLQLGLGADWQPRYHVVLDRPSLRYRLLQNQRSCRNLAQLSENG